MTESGASSGRAGPRLPWVVFGVVSTLALGFCVVLAQASGGWTNAGLVLLAGLVAIGIAGLLVSAIVSPLPGQSQSGSGSGQALHGPHVMEGGGLDGGGLG